MKRALICVALWASSARADVLHATREQPLVELSHTVDVRVDGGVATYKVRRVFSNPGKLADEAGLAIDLPAGAAATGLRIRAHQTWFEGELMEAALAAALYHELTGLGAYTAKDPALLQWLWADKLYLQVFPVMPHGVSTVEYTLTVPTRYEGGRYWLSYPRVDAAASQGTDREGATLRLATPVITVHDAATIDGRHVTAGTPIVLRPPARPPWADAVSAEPGASYVASSIVVPRSSHTDRIFEKATVTLDIAHTYKSDLRVQLVTPEGNAVTLHDRSGAGANNLRGSYPVELPVGTHGDGTWRLVVSDHAALDTGTLDGWSLALGDGRPGAPGERARATDTPVFIPDAPESASDAGVASIAVGPPPIATWTARLGRVVASDQHAFARLEVDVAPELRPLPKRAQVAFVLDASYSIGEEGLAAELDVVRAYLAHVPDAEIELIAVRRRAERVFGKFVAARVLEAAIADARKRGALALGNGSALDDGARVAAAAIAERTGPRRVVLVTDELLRPSLSDADALAALAAMPADAIVHVVVPRLDHDDRATLERDDQDPLAALATQHHGILVDLGGLPARAPKELAPVVLELVKPTRIDHLAVAGVTVTDTLLREGSGLRVMVADTTAPDKVVLTGALWSDPVRAEVTASDAFSRQTAALVFGADEHGELSHDEMLKVAMMGRVVSPVTSYVAFEPGTRPSPIGLPREGTGWGTIGAGRYGTIGLGAGMGRTPPDLRAMVAAAACVGQHHPAAGWHVRLAVETTRDEIVDVTVVTGSGPVSTCLAEATWAVRLDSRFSRDHEHFELAFADD